MKAAAVIILYYPDHRVKSNIESFDSFVDIIYVFDNTPVPSEVGKSLQALPKVHYTTSGENLGVARRLNEACELAMKQGYEWLLTMDQDTRFSNGSAGDYFRCIDLFPDHHKVAMFGTSYGVEDLQSTSACNPEITDALITSGSMVNLNAFREIGHFDENLFVDSVDHEYCVRARLLNYKLIRFGNIYIRHEIGELVRRTSIKSLFLIKKEKTIHSPVRCYYMYRNMLYLERKYRKIDSQFARLIRKYVITYVSNFLLYGRQTVRLIRYLRLAHRDFTNGVMGRISHPPD